MRLLYHNGCERGHWNFRAVRKCADRYVQMDETETRSFVEMRPEQWAEVEAALRLYRSDLEGRIESELSQGELSALQVKWYITNELLERGKT
jgi:hypothetical protein